MTHHISQDQEAVHSEISRAMSNISYFLSQMLANNSNMSELDMVKGLTRIKAQTDFLLSKIDSEKQTSSEKITPIPGSKLSSLIVDLMG